MTSLMSIFDPSMSMIPQCGWLTVFLGFLIMKFSFWRGLSPLLAVQGWVVSILLKLFKHQKVMFISLFIFILNMNVMGLLPLVFSPTSHLSFNFTIALCLWLGMMGWYAKNNLSQLLSHMTPLGSPMVLSPVLVLIELVSTLIRPITLSLRLMANVMAGHMVMTLISKGVYCMSSWLAPPMFILLMGFLLFEFGVALIQSYVFASLMSLYWEESEKSH